MRRAIHHAVRFLVLIAPFAVFFPVTAQTPALDAERMARSGDAMARDALQSLAGLYRAARLLELHAEDPKQRDAFLEQVKSRGANPIARDHARWLLAERMVRAGKLEAARTEMRTIGVVDRAMMVGPFANTGGGAFGSPTPADDVAATLDTALAGLEANVRWHPVELEPYGAFDLGAQMSAVKETRALVAFVVQTPRADAIALRIGSNGQVRAKVNGFDVGKDDVDRARALDQSVFGAQLVKGANLIVLELGFLDNAGSITVRLTRPDGSALTGVRVEHSAPELKAAALKAAAGGKPTGSPPKVDNPFVQSGPVPRTRMLADLETYLGAGDERARPRRLRTWLEALVADASVPPLERGGATARLGIELREVDLSRARELYEEALTLDPRNVPALLELADIRNDQGRPQDAREFLKRAVSAAPTSDVVQQRWLDFTRRTSSAGPSADAAVLARARSAPTPRNLAAAADVLEERGELSAALALVKSAEDAVWMARLEAELARMQLVEASAEDADPLPLLLAAQARQLALRPSNHDLAERVALALLAAGRPDDARALVLARQGRWPERAEPDATLARLELLRGDRAGAVAALAAAIAKKPQDTELAALRRALEKEDPLVERYALDVDMLRALPPHPGAADPGAETLAMSTAIRLFDNGLARMITERVYRVLDAKKARGLQTLSFDYSDGRETLEVLVAERVSKGGRRQAARRVFDDRRSGKVGGVYTDSAARMVDFGPLEDGDVLFVRVRKELVGRQNLFGDFFGVLEPIQSFLPTRRWQLTIEAPAGKSLTSGGKGAPRPTVTERDGLRVVSFEKNDAPPLAPEPHMPPFMELTDFVSVSTYGTWPAMGAWYEALAAPALVLDDELRAIARREKDAAKDEADLVRRLYELVVTSTRYVGIELGIHGWKPYPVVEVFRRKYGDCKDKASLLVALLREAGVPANLALVRTANLGTLADAPPSMWTFNHAIAYVPSLDLFLDGTAEQSGWRELPTMDQGAQALIVGKHGTHAESRLVQIPVQEPDANRNVSSYVLTLDAAGTLEVKGSERFRGSANANERREMQDPATRRDKLQAHLARVMPGTAVHKVEVTALDLAQQELGYDFTATLPARAVVQGDALVMPLSLYPHDLAGSYADRSTRNKDIFLDHPWHTRNVMRYVLPPGLQLVELPSGGSVDGKHVRFTQKVERTADGFIVDEDTWLLSRRIPAAEYAAFRKDAIAADALMKRKLTIQRTRAPRGGT